MAEMVQEKLDATAVVMDGTVTADLGWAWGVGNGECDCGDGERKC